jgi:hypothetical protein
MSEYGTQLREKQKAKRAYGVLESQFRKYFEMANKMKGKTGDNCFSCSREGWTTSLSVWDLEIHAHRPAR